MARTRRTQDKDVISRIADDGPAGAPPCAGGGALTVRGTVSKSRRGSRRDGPKRRARRAPPARDCGRGRARDPRGGAGGRRCPRRPAAGSARALAHRASGRRAGDGRSARERRARRRGSVGTRDRADGGARSAGSDEPHPGAGAGRCAGEPADARPDRQDGAQPRVSECAHADPVEPRAARGDERAVDVPCRGDGRRPPRSQVTPGGQPPVRYGGIATRGLALAVDAALATMIFLTGIAVIGFVLSLVWNPRPASLVGSFIGVVGLLVEAAYFSGFWSTAGQTPGMRMMHLRVVDRAGSAPGLGRSLLRLFGLGLAILLLLTG